MGPLRTFALAGLLCLLPATASAADLEIATLAPRSSAWGKVFAAWSKAVAKKTDDRLTLTFHFSGVQGDDGAVVAKVRSGQLDGATLGARGLSLIHRPALALQLPGLFRSYASIERARDALYPRLAKAFAKQGFYLSSIGDVGQAHTFSKGRAVRVPADLKTMKPFATPESVVAPVIASEIGVTPVKLPVPALLPALSAGRVDVVTAPAIGVELLQWAPHLDYVHEEVAGIAVGAMVLRNDRLEPLPEDVKETLRKTGKRAGQLLRKRVRKMDRKAYKRVAKKMTVVKLSSSELKQWGDLFARVRNTLAQTTFDRALVTELEQLAGQ